MGDFMLVGFIKNKLKEKEVRRFYEEYSRRVADTPVYDYIDETPRERVISEMEAKRPEGTRGREKCFICEVPAVYVSEWDLYQSGPVKYRRCEACGDAKIL
jgi:hypothetical protein